MEIICQSIINNFDYKYLKSVNKVVPPRILVNVFPHLSHALQKGEVMLSKHEFS